MTIFVPNRCFSIPNIYRLHIFQKFQYFINRCLKNRFFMSINHVKNFLRLIDLRIAIGRLYLLASEYHKGNCNEYISCDQMKYIKISYSLNSETSLSDLNPNHTLPCISQYIAIQFIQIVLQIPSKSSSKSSRISTKRRSDSPPGIYSRYRLGRFLCLLRMPPLSSISWRGISLGFRTPPLFSSIPLVFAIHPVSPGGLFSSERSSTMSRFVPRGLCETAIGASALSGTRTTDGRGRTGILGTFSV